MKYLPPVMPILAHEFLAWIHKINRHKKSLTQKVVKDPLNVFHKDYFTFYNRDLNSQSETNFA